MGQNSYIIFYLLNDFNFVIKYSIIIYQGVNHAGTRSIKRREKFLS